MRDLTGTLSGRRTDKGGPTDSSLRLGFEAGERDYGEKKALQAHVATVGVVPFIEGVRAAALPSPAKRHSRNSERERDVCVGRAELDPRAIAEKTIDIANCARSGESSGSLPAGRVPSERMFNLECVAGRLRGGDFVPHARAHCIAQGSFKAGEFAGRPRIADRFSPRRSTESN